MPSALVRRWSPRSTCRRLARVPKSTAQDLHQQPYEESPEVSAFVPKLSQAAAPQELVFRQNLSLKPLCVEGRKEKWGEVVKEVLSKDACKQAA